MLTASAILKAIESHKISIAPFDKKYLNPNSYNVHLGNKIKVYRRNRVLDTLSDNPPDYEEEILDEGIILHPGNLYITNIEERISTNFYISSIDGRSSIGRLGLQIHATAGFGDIGFDGHYTLEMIPTVPIKVYKGLEIGQVYFEVPDGEVDFLYKGRYQGQVEPTISKIQINSSDIKGYHYDDQKEKETEN